MKQVEKLKAEIRRSTTNKDETNFLLSLVDSAISETVDKELSESDSYLLTEIEELTDFANKLINLTNAQASEIAKLEEREQQLLQQQQDLKDAFKIDNNKGVKQ